ncbi:kinetochore complex Sim4 subunit Fta1-domain-containing protein [Cladorrhinum sp. PSN332]|nr:kinetochore complex Sim4 subunit Fta1-domain-containing protein [Cladorrhinum sp. PSN332]
MSRRRPPPQPTQSSPSRTEQPDQDEEEEQIQHSLLSVSTTTTTTSRAGFLIPSFYNTTFSCHRVSPLHNISPIATELFSPARLDQLAQRLRDRLVGDVVRGVEVGLVAADANGEDGGAMGGKQGALEGVEVRLVGVGEIVGLREQEEHDDDEKCVVISLRYENAQGTGILFPGNRREGILERGDTRFFLGGGDLMDLDVDQALRLPLLLLRMPAPLKGVVAEFLQTEFDCRVSAMRLGSRSITRCWERWVGRSSAWEGLAKDVVVTVGFNAAALAAAEEGKEEGEQSKVQQGLGIKTIDVIIPGTEVKRFEKAGKRIAQHKNVGGWEGDLKRRRELAGRLREEGWEWRLEEGTDKQPFTEALGRYLRQHTAIDLFHPAVRVVKIACGGFVIAEQRLKIFKPGGEEQRRAAWELLGEIIEKAEVTTV